MNLFKMFARSRRIRINPEPTFRISLADWTASPVLVSSAARLFITPEFRTMVSVLRNESPSSYGLGLGATHDDQIAHCYKAAGYNLCLNNLEALAVLNKSVAPLEASFSPEPPQLVSEPVESFHPGP